MTEDNDAHILPAIYKCIVAFNLNKKNTSYYISCSVNIRITGRTTAEVTALANRVVIISEMVPMHPASFVELAQDKV